MNNNKKTKLFISSQKQKDIKFLILEMGTLLADYDHKWSNDLRKKFDKVISFLSSSH